MAQRLFKVSRQEIRNAILADGCALDVVVIVTPLLLTILFLVKFLTFAVFRSIYKKYVLMHRLLLLFHFQVITCSYNLFINILQLFAIFHIVQSTDACLFRFI